MKIVVTQGQLLLLHRTVRRAVWSCLNLPKDTPTAYIHAMIVDGNLGTLTFAKRVSRLKKDFLSRQRALDDPDVRLVDSRGQDC